MHFVPARDVAGAIGAKNDMGLTPLNRKTAAANAKAAAVKNTAAAAPDEYHPPARRLFDSVSGESNLRSSAVSIH